MRELLLPEIEMVSGGDSVDWVVSGGGITLNTGTHHWDGGSSPSDNLGGSGDGWDSSEADDEGGGIEDYLTSEELCQWEEHNIDSLAEIAAEQIMLQPDWNAREYGYIIYRDADGDFRTGPMEVGSTVAEVGQFAQAELGITQDMLNGEILGFIHNHPDIGYGPGQDSDNRNPSEGDWAAYHQLIDNFGAVSDLSMYILGPDGVLREFHASDEQRHTADNNPSNPDSNNDVRNGQC